MYSEKLNNLINAAIADGEISLKERAVLHKVAKSEGVDQDELDIYIDGLISIKRENDSIKKKQYEDSARRNINKCPCCGEIIPSTSGVCPSCGYVLNKNKENELDIIKQLENTYSQLSTLNLTEKTIKGFIKFWKIMFIIGFFIPFGLIYLIFRKKKDTEQKINKKTYSEIKYEFESILNTAKSLYKNNKVIYSKITEIETRFYKEAKSIRKRAFIINSSIILGPILLVVLYGCFATGVLLYDEYAYSEEEKIAATDSLKQYIENKETAKAFTYLSTNEGKINNLKNSYEDLLNTCLKNKDYNTTKKIYDEINQNWSSSTSKIFRTTCITHFIKEGKYEEAEYYINKDGSDFYYKSYYDYLVKCVEHISKYKGKEKALKFAKRKSLWFTSDKIYNEKEYTSDAVLERLTLIIKNS